MVLTLSSSSPSSVLPVTVTDVPSRSLISGECAAYHGGPKLTERDPAKAPANFQKRVFPFRIEGVRGPNLLQVNMNIMRTVRLGGGRSLSFRVDAINVLNRTTFANPNLNPTSTDFGRISSATAASPRFIQFVNRFTF